jgi:hypothetical protein
MSAVELLLNTVEWHETGMTDDGDDLPYPTHKGVLNIGGIELKCYRLSNGKRVLDAESVARFFGCNDVAEFDRQREAIKARIARGARQTDGRVI